MKVILIGGIHHNTLGVIRALGEKGVDKEDVFVILMSDNRSGNMLTASRYISRQNVYYSDQENLHKTLLRLIGQLPEKPVVISCCDEGTAAIYRHYDELGGECMLPGVLIADKTSIMNKDVQDSYAQAAGLNVPKSMVVRADANEAKDWNAFPCIIKPINSAKHGGGKDEIKVLCDKSLLLNNLMGGGIQIQEYIQKQLEYQLIGVSLNGGEIVIIPGYTNIIRQPNNTNTGYLKYSPISGLDYDHHAVLRFIKSIGYSGLFSIEFIRDKNGKDYFLEINMRNDGNAYVVTKSGVNLPYIWFHYNLYGRMPENEPIEFNEPIYFMPELQDFRNVLTRKVGFLTWLKQFNGAKAKSVWNTDDMKPFYSMLYHKIVK